MIGSPRRRHCRRLRQGNSQKICCTYPVLHVLTSISSSIHRSDFNDEPAVEGKPSGLAATQVLSQTPAAANLLAGTSSNPLDDLVSIFGGPSDTPVPPALSNIGSNSTPLNAFGGLGMLSPVPPTPQMASGPGPQPTGFSAPPLTPQTSVPLTPGIGLGIAQQQPPPQTTKPEDDLLGLF